MRHQVDDIGVVIAIDVRARRHQLPKSGRVAKVHWDGASRKCLEDLLRQESAFLSRALNRCTNQSPVIRDTKRERDRERKVGVVWQRSLVTP